MTAFADLPEDMYYHLKVVQIGNNVDNTYYLSIDPNNPDSLLLLDRVAMLNRLDYSLWSFTGKSSVAGLKTYEILNKKGIKFSFDEPSGPIIGNDPNDAKESLATLQTEGALSGWSDIDHSTGAFSLQSVVGEFTYYLAFSGKDSITLVSTAGNTKSAKLYFVLEKPSAYWMKATELNAKLDNGFKLYFYYQDKEITSALLPLVSGMKLRANTENIYGETAFYIHAAENLNDFLYVDTVSYSTDTIPELLYGSHMILKMGNFPLSWGINPAKDSLRLFSFKTDPGSFANDVTIFAHATNTWAGEGWKPVTRETNDLVPVQIDYDKQVFYLVTDTLLADPETRITFKDVTYPSKLEKGKVYSVKVLNQNANQGKYWVSTQDGTKSFANTVNDQLAYTQFVYQGNEIVNRESAAVRTTYLLKISATEDIYVNELKDTLEIKEMVNADKHSSDLSFAGFKASLLDEFYMVDIVNGAFSGKVIGMSADSVVGVMEKDDAKYFYLSPADALRAYGGAAKNVTSDGKDSVSVQKRQSYYLKSINKNEYVYVDMTANKLIMTTKDSTAFYLRKTIQPREYILIYGSSDVQDIGEDKSKVQVNSQSGLLELVDIKLSDNYFRIRPESDIATYKKDAKGYYEFASFTGQRLTKNADDFAVFRNEGESVMKSDLYVADDFKLYLEPAVTTGQYEDKPSYYIVKDAKRGEGQEIAGYFLHVLDSGKVADPGKFQVEIGGQYFNRINFVNAKRFSGDSILVNYDSDTQTKADSIGYKGKNEKGMKEYRFFLRATDQPDEYLLVSEFGVDGQGNEDGYLSVLNDILFISPRSSAGKVIVRQTDPPVANNQVNGGEIKVVSEKGSLIILNASGKQITITDMLGRKIREHFVSSDQERIELSQGIVILNIAGENAFKAIVK